MENSVVIIPSPNLFDRLNIGKEELLPLIEVIKLSLCYFDRIFVDEDIVDSIINSDIEKESDIIEALYPRKNFIKEKTSGVIKLSVFQSHYEPINIVSVNKKFPYEDDWLADANRARAKFGRFDDGFDLEWDILGRLGEKIKEHHLAIFQIVGVLLESSTNSYNDGSTKSTSLEGAVIQKTMELYSVDLSEATIKEIIRMRKKKCFTNLQNRVDNIVTQTYGMSQDKIDEIIRWEIRQKIEDQKMTPKKYIVKMAMGFAGYVPIVSSLLNLINIGIDTKKFIDSRNDWFSFFTSLESK